MIIWLALLVFGVPLVLVIIQSKKGNKADNDRLNAIQRRLAEKQQEKGDTFCPQQKRSEPNQPISRMKEINWVLKNGKCLVFN